MSKQTSTMDKIVSLCKRRGFVFQSSEIYGGINSIYDYGPLGIELKKNIKDLWWKSMVYDHDNIVGLDSGILMHPRIWEASGHVEGFTDPLVDCKKCKARFRGDKLDEAICPQTKKPITEECRANFTEPRQFNLMFKTFMGPVEDDASVVYLRPETAQGIYVNFHNVKDSSRQKIPFGIAQIGKAFRNEVTPGNFVFRMREFEQMEMQFFVRPDSDNEWFEKWKEARFQWYEALGIKRENLRFHEHGKDELAHYAKAAYDIEYKFPFDWQEIEGIHNRTDFDLKRHQEYSGKDLRYFDDEIKEKYIPYVIETSTGVDRLFLVTLADAYVEEEDRVVLKFKPSIAPVKAAILPLVKKDGLPEIARNLLNDLRKQWNVFYDESGSIGRRYRRMDEIGTPYCITIDYDTKNDQSVTVRERDSMEQKRIAISEIKSFLSEKLI
ncbi:MAG: glycine--tRNA ligase [Calditrichia bacterium]